MYRSQIFGINVSRLRAGFITVGPNIVGGSEAYFADSSQSTFVTKSVLYDVQTIIFDAILVRLLLL